MKSKQLLTLLCLVIYSILFSTPVFSAAKNDNGEPILSGREIDLLVGTPKNISEPLDPRRNSITDDNIVDYSGFLDEDALSDENDNGLNWEDAEDSTPNENQVENQLMDLLAETEELEKTDEIFYYDEEKGESKTTDHETEEIEATE